jgi:DNA-directed RNA polymerase subunit RPC12/RpoP
MFKEKTSKKRLNVTNNEKDNSTLDVMHNKMIKSFAIKCQEKEQYLQMLDNLEKTQHIIKLQIEFVALNDREEIIYNELWTSNILLSEEIINIRGKIKEIETFDEIEYYKKTSSILFNYYDMLEKQSRIKSNMYIHKKKHINYESNSGQKSILDALNYKLISPAIAPKTEIESNPLIDKSTLVDEYLFETSKTHVKKFESDDLELCIQCKNIMTCLQHDAIIICEKCGYQELLLVEQNRPILKHNIKDTSHFSYKRINHFREWCNQVQGKESTDIPDEIFEKILNEIKKEKITDTRTITYAKMREILKRLRINKYYEHINYIINRINGIPTPQFPPDLEDKLCNMFRDIQGPFLKHCPRDRKNFLSYSYVLYKFFQILGLTEYLKYFPLLKSREKLYVQDQIWRKICEELNYEFIPSPSL